MTEPVAYVQIKDGKAYSVLRKGTPNDEYTPVYTAEQLHPRVKMTQAEFDELEKSLINAQFDYSELKKTIEIVPDMKWFVRSKERVMGLYMFLSNLTTLRDPYYFTKNDDTSFAHRFDTKEEAEKWVNPLTEAVQLPVEGE